MNGPGYRRSGEAYRLKKSVAKTTKIRSQIRWAFKYWRQTTTADFRTKVFAIFNAALAEVALFGRGFTVLLFFFHELVVGELIAKACYHVIREVIQPAAENQTGSRERLELDNT